MNESYSMWPLCLASLTGHHVFKLHADCSMDHASFLFMAELQSMAWLDHILFICLSVEGHLGCFHFLIIVNNAVVNTCVHVLFEHKFSVLLVYAWEWSCWVIR